jgi:glycerol-3-phosphate dehydrogenase (NAD(P)+)
MNDRPFAILGAGNMGTALALVLSRHKRPVNLYCIEGDVEEDINVRGRNTKYLKGVGLPRNIRAFADPAEALRGAEIAIVAVPSFAIEEVVALSLPFLSPDCIVAVVTKGLDRKTLLPKIETARRLLPRIMRKRVAAISGPAIATELAKGKPAAVLLAGEDRTALKKLAGYLANGTLKVAISDDLRGASLCMAMKNAYAIALGMCDGLDFPMNTKALVLTMALEEMSHLVRAAGGDSKTVMTLAGLGDLVVSGFSSHGRNRTYGERLVGARSKDPARLGLGTVEGIATVPTALRLARRRRVKTPLLSAIGKCVAADAHYEQPFIEYLKHLSLL